MNTLEWAKNEIAIASKRERGNKPENEWDYGCACYDSALKAFESLLGDGHGGTSISFTKNILNRLIDRNHSLLSKIQRICGTMHMIKKTAVSVISVKE